MCDLVVKCYSFFYFFILNWATVQALQDFRLGPEVANLAGPTGQVWVFKENPFIKQGKFGHKEAQLEAIPTKELSLVLAVYRDI